MARLQNKTKIKNPSERKKFCSRGRIIADIIGFCYAFSVGFIALHIDFANRRIKTSTYYKVVITLNNFLFLMSAPLTFSMGRNYFDKQFSYNSLVRMVHTLNMLLSLVLAMWLISQRWRRERQIARLARELFSLDTSYFDRQPFYPHIERRFDCMVQLKLLTILAQAFGITWVTLRLTNSIDWNTLFLAFCMIQFTNLMHCILFYYFYLLWHAYKRFCVLNEQLQLLKASLRNLTSHQGGYYIWGHVNSRAAKELHEISLVHWRLSRYVFTLNANSMYPIMGVLLWYLLHDAVGGYLIALLWEGMLPIKLSIPAFMGIMCIFSLFFVDLNLCFWLSESTMNAQMRAATILREFQMLPRLEGELEQNCTIFALQLKQRQMQINMTGMFNLRKQSALAMWAYSFRHVLIFVQFEYEERFRKHQEMRHLDNV